MSDQDQARKTLASLALLGQTYHDAHVKSDQCAQALVAAIREAVHSPDKEVRFYARDGIEAKVASEVAEYTLQAFIDHTKTLARLAQEHSADTNTLTIELKNGSCLTIVFPDETNKPQ